MGGIMMLCLWKICKYAAGCFQYSGSSVSSYQPYFDESGKTLKKLVLNHCSLSPWEAHASKTIEYLSEMCPTFSYGELYLNVSWSTCITHLLKLLKAIQKSIK